jgi:2-oxoglutarate dehydrogenase E2 component (dihydrolipoamide succinyltransferase)
MAQVNVILPAMGEGVIEATITKWLVSEGASVTEEDPVVEVATDKVDTEIPAPSSGKLVKIIAPEGTVAKVGEIIAVIENEGDGNRQDPERVEKEVMRIRETIDARKQEKNDIAVVSKPMASRTPSGKFISPLVRSIAAGEGISYSELDSIKGSGMDGRITRDDVLGYLRGRKNEEATAEPAKAAEASQALKESPAVNKKTSRGDEVIEMDRVRKLIADHMVMSKRTSPHVTSFIDVDMTGVVNWRNSIKEKFLAREGHKITLTPVFIDAAARALTDYPMINISVDGTSIIKKRDINIGMATALPDGNLIVPVIKNANEKNLTGLAKAVNDLSERARNNKLKPDEITEGTFTVTNYGTYNNLAGTPIINQPQTAILGIGAVRKTPAVVETPHGDAIAIRQIVILSLSYDHRVIDGALAGKFLNRIKEILENRIPEIS